MDAAAHELTQSAAHPYERPHERRLSGIFRVRPRQAVFSLVLALHALLLVAALLPSRLDRVPVPIPAIEVHVIADTPAQTAAPPLPPLVLERPHIDHITPEVPLIEPAPDAPIAAPPAPATAATAAVAAAAKGAPGPAEPVTPPRFDAAYLNNPPPIYPLASRRLHEQGTVLLRVRVSGEGAALEVLVEHPSGSPHLDEAAMAAVRRWRFVPAKRGNESVEAWVLVPVEFELDR